VGPLYYKRAESDEAKVAFLLSGTGGPLRVLPELHEVLGNHLAALWKARNVALDGNAEGGEEQRSEQKASGSTDIRSYFQPISRPPSRPLIVPSDLQELPGPSHAAHVTHMSLSVFPGSPKAGGANGNGTKARTD